MRTPGQRGARIMRGRARDPKVTSRILAAVKGRDTGPELLLRRALHRRGLRYRLHAPSVVGRPDIVFARHRVAVFVDGEYWYGKGWRARGFRSVEDQFARWGNGDWWFVKIRCNVARDRRENRQLCREGWTVLRFTDAAVHRSLDRCVSQVLTAIGRRT